MPENEILAEIHRIREAIARENDFDVAKLFAYYRRRELERKDDGHPLVKSSRVEPESSVVREQPPET
jgi:hypothetical protein